MESPELTTLRAYHAFLGHRLQVDNEAYKFKQKFNQFKMRLCLIYSVWADFDWLEISLKIMRPLADGVIIIASTRSTHGEYYPIPEQFKTHELHIREPKFHIPMHSETDKRNFGLEIAKNEGYTHFLMMDADEIYRPDEFLRAKEKFKSDLKGLVCPSIVYFGSPDLTIGRDITLVPFIHKITPTIRHEFNRGYPYAWINGQIRIDPTRSLNINSGVEYSEEIEMHHFSHVRTDYKRKIRNSTARVNLERSTILNDLLHAKEGYFVDFYRKSLVPATVDFGIHETGNGFAL